MDALELFLIQHASMHSAPVADGPAALEDVALRRLDEPLMRIRPNPGQNSVAWLLWHMARCEDVGVNAILAGAPQVIDQDDWLARLGIPRRDIGTAMLDDEVAGFSERVDIAALRAYRQAVGRRTREVVATLRREKLNTPIDEELLARAFADGALGSERAQWVVPWWQGKSKAWTLSWLAVGHNYLHLGELQSVRGQAGVPVGL